MFLILFCVFVIARADLLILNKLSNIETNIEINKLYNNEIVWLDSFCGRTNYTTQVDHPMIDKVIESNQINYTPHLTINTDNNNFIPLSFKSKMLIPVRKQSLMIVGWDDDYETFTWKHSDLVRYSQSFEINLKQSIQGNAKGDKPGLLCSSLVQIVSSWSPNANIEVKRYPKESHLIDFLYDLIATKEDRLPDFVLFSQGTPECKECEDLFYKLRLKGVNFVASNQIYLHNKVTLAYPSSSQYVISIGSTHSNKAISLTEYNYCVSNKSDLSMYGLAHIVHNNIPVRVGGTSISATLFVCSLIDLSSASPKDYQWKEVIEDVYDKRICLDCFTDIIYGNCFDLAANYGKDDLTGMGHLDVDHMHQTLKDFQQTHFIAPTARPSNQNYTNSIYVTFLYVSSACLFVFSFYMFATVFTSVHSSDDQGETSLEPKVREKECILDSEDCKFLSLD